MIYNNADEKDKQKLQNELNGILSQINDLQEIGVSVATSS